MSDTYRFDLSCFMNTGPGINKIWYILVRDLLVENTRNEFLQTKFKIND